MKDNKKRKIPREKIILYALVAVIILLLLIVLVLLVKLRMKPVEPPVEDTGNDVVDTLPPDDTEEEIDPANKTKPGKIGWMADLYEQNPDIVAWIKIEGTKLDYPVMFTPDDEEKYMYKNFEGGYDFKGLPFIDKDCSVEPESDNIIMYGHNMNNGTAFNTIMSYVSQSFWEEHPYISYTTLYEERTYEIVAAFYDKVYYKTDTCFKFYQFIDVEDEEHFDEAMTYFIEHSCIDTGVTPEYGDNFIMLVTCSYHVDNGRFVVIAREVTETTETNE